LNRRRRIKGRPTPLEFLSDLTAWCTLHLPGRVPCIATDRELRTFIGARFPLMSIDQIVAACRERFGEARTPSRASVARYRRSIGLRRMRVRPLILRSATLTAFIDERLPRRRSFLSVAAACRKRFGEWAPSWQTISRYSRKQSGRR
jgi:hypothetical protein